MHSSACRLRSSYARSQRWGGDYSVMIFPQLNGRRGRLKIQAWKFSIHINMGCNSCRCMNASLPLIVTDDEIFM
jgi:hypothetical protein